MRSAGDDTLRVRAVYLGAYAVLPGHDTLGVKRVSAYAGWYNFLINGPSPQSLFPRSRVAASGAGRSRAKAARYIFLFVASGENVRVLTLTEQAHGNKYAVAD